MILKGIMGVRSHIGERNKLFDANNTVDENQYPSKIELCGTSFELPLIGSSPEFSEAWQSLVIRYYNSMSCYPFPENDQGELRIILHEYLEKINTFEEE